MSKQVVRTWAGSEEPTGARIFAFLCGFSLHVRDEKHRNAGQIGEAPRRNSSGSRVPPRYPSFAEASSAVMLFNVRGFSLRHPAAGVTGRDSTHGRVAPPNPKPADIGKHDRATNSHSERGGAQVSVRRRADGDLHATPLAPKSIGWKGQLKFQTAPRPDGGSSGDKPRYTAQASSAEVVAV